MAEERPHTKTYRASDRKRLGVAVTRARKASEYPWRPSFAAAVGLSVSSVLNLESGKPVGPDVYEAVARNLPRWTEDTPVSILDGANPPPTTSDDKTPKAETKQFDPRVLKLWQAYLDWAEDYGHSEARRMVQEQIDLLMLRILSDRRTRSDIERNHDE